MGGGVLLWEFHNNRKGRTGLAVILFRNKFSGRFEDPGGACDDEDGSLVTAQRELEEESLGLFVIHPQHFQKKYSVQVKQYVAYNLFVRAERGIDQRYYDQNYRKLKEERRGVVPHCWRETNGFQRFYLEDLINAGIWTARSDFICPDSNGVVQMFQRRAILVIQSTLDEKIVEPNGKISPPCLQLNLCQSRTNGPSFAQGTSCYFS